MVTKSTIHGELQVITSLSAARKDQHSDPKATMAGTLSAIILQNRTLTRTQTVLPPTGQWQRVPTFFREGVGWALQAF